MRQLIRVGLGALLVTSGIVGCSSEDAGDAPTSTTGAGSTSTTTGTSSTNAASTTNTQSTATANTAAVTTGGSTTSSVTSTSASTSEASTSGTETSSTSGGAATTTGSGGSTATSTTGSAIGPGEFLGDLDGYLYTGECDGGTASFECPLSDCMGNVFNEEVSFTAAGDASTTYDVTVHVYGVVELRSDYSGGSRRQGNQSNADGNKDFWYEGGSYTPGAGYNVYGLRVTPAVEGVANADSEGNNYFLNARDSSGEGHEVWELNFEATFPVAGGGTVQFTAYDPNCLQIMNNQETARPSGDGPGGSIVIDDVNNTDPPANDFTQPLSTDGRNGQWVFIDVIDVAAR